MLVTYSDVVSTVPIDHWLLWLFGLFNIARFDVLTLTVL